jgi:Domain of unknown function (DUF5658)
MSWRHLQALIVVGVVLCPGLTARAFAQDTGGPVVADAPTVVAHLFVPSVLLPAAPVSLPVADPAIARPRRSAFMTSLYTSTALMQGLDVHSTLLAFQHGARESNPLMAGITSNRAVFVATKAAVAVGTILAARSVSKHNKVMAAVTLVAINSAYALVVSHNYQVARAAR